MKVWVSGWFVLLFFVTTVYAVDQKVALIVGVTGQDGAYLAEFLLSKGYQVHGIKRRSSSFNTARIDHLYKDRHRGPSKFFLHYGDVTDATQIMRTITEIQPDEIYNLSAQSHVHVSFQLPVYTTWVDGLGVLHILEAMRIISPAKKIKFYQASTSELYGKVQETPQTEQLHSILVLRMGLQNCMVFGLPKTIENHTTCLPAMVFCLITNRQCVVRRLLQERLRAQ